MESRNARVAFSCEEHALRGCVERPWDLEVRFAVWRKIDGSGCRGKVLLYLRLFAGSFYVVIIHDHGEARGRPTRVAGEGGGDYKKAGFRDYFSRRLHINMALRGH